MEIPHATVTKKIHSILYGGLTTFAFAVILPLFAAVPIGCSRGASMPVSGLQSIQVLPVQSISASGTTKLFTAIGTFSDGSTRDVTNSVTWSSSNTGVATIGGSGMVSATGKGVTTISAKAGEISGRIRLDVEAERAHFAYVANHDVNTIAILGIDADTGQLSTAGSVTVPGSGPRYVELRPAGDFLFVTHDLSNTIASYAVNAVTGELTLVPGTPVPTGAGPKNIATDPAGKLLYLSNAGSNNVSGYAVSSGALPLRKSSHIPGVPGSSSNFIQI